MEGRSLSEVEGWGMAFPNDVLDYIYDYVEDWSLSGVEGRSLSGVEDWSLSGAEGRSLSGVEDRSLSGVEGRGFGHPKNLFN